jgi:hypothetical protein
MFRTVIKSALVWLTIMAVSGAAFAQGDLPRFDENVYRNAGADSNATIAPGTRITAQNWQNYRKFMPLGMQLLLEGKAMVKVPNDFEIVIGPTESYPLPKKYREDTEKYSRQVQLVQLPAGGYTLKGYLPGCLFPIPAALLPELNCFTITTMTINPTPARLT